MALELTFTNTEKQLVGIFPDGAVTGITFAITSGDCTLAFDDAGTPLPEGQAFIVSGTAVADSTGTVSATNSAGVVLTDTFTVHVTAAPATALNLTAINTPVPK